MNHLGIEMIAAYSPQERGRSERAFGTHQGRLPKELALHGIATMDAANRYLADIYQPAHNTEFMSRSYRDYREKVRSLCPGLEQTLTTSCASSTHEQ